MEKIQKYPKIYRQDNMNDRDIPKGEPLVIQEKLDGSNITVELLKSGEMNLFSRRMKIDESSESNQWDNLIKWARENYENTWKDLVSKGDYEFRLHGEWLEHQKLEYNRSYSKTFWLFDVKYKKVEEEKWKWAFFKTDGDELKIEELSKMFKVDMIPFKEIESLEKFLENKEDLVENQRSFLEKSDAFREGVILKTLNSSKKIKFVSKVFEEKVFKTKTQSLVIITQDLATPARIDKYISKLRELNLISMNELDFNDKKSLGPLYKNMKELVEDFEEEELEKMIKLFKKTIRKNIGNSMKHYIKSKQEEQAESKES